MKTSIEEQVKDYLRAHGNYDPNPKSSEVPEPINSVPEEFKFYVVENGKLVVKDARAVLKKKQRTHQGKAIREFICEASGAGGIMCTKTECRAHIITQKFAAIRATRKNLLYICKKHEKYFNEAGLSIWFTFVKESYPDKFEFVRSEFEYILKEYEEFLKLCQP